MQVNLQTYGYTHWGERAAAGTASSPLRVLRASKLDGSPGLLRWRCCHGGGFPLQYARACFMTHSFLTLGFISYDDVYITNGVYIFIRKILWSCTVVFLRMSVSFTMYLVRDDLINKWNQKCYHNLENPRSAACLFVHDLLYGSPVDWHVSLMISSLSLNHLTNPTMHQTNDPQCTIL